MQAAALTVLFDGFLLLREGSGVRSTTLDAYRTMCKALCEWLPTRRPRPIEKDGHR